MPQDVLYTPPNLRSEVNQLLQQYESLARWYQERSGEPESRTEIQTELFWSYIYYYGASQAIQEVLNLIDKYVG